ncbi:DUF4372 domain-containing protein [Virgibacillus sp. JSM 102003]|uniref:DUF4372 domain-containing protein n=1 Tax=Virgibacillus sp. JSM 102003 TaxID=1562108 RepID=UPI0035C0B0CD
MDNDTMKTVYIHPLDSKVIQELIDHTEINKYVKKLDVLTFSRLFIYVQLKGLTSLRRISENVKRVKRYKGKICDSISI